MKKVFGQRDFGQKIAIESECNISGERI